MAADASPRVAHRPLLVVITNAPHRVPNIASTTSPISGLPHSRRIPLRQPPSPRPPEGARCRHAIVAHRAFGRIRFARCILEQRQHPNDGRESVTSAAITATRLRPGCQVRHFSTRASSQPGLFTSCGPCSACPRGASRWRGTHRGRLRAPASTRVNAPACASRVRDAHEHFQANFGAARYRTIGRIRCSRLPRCATARRRSRSNTRAPHSRDPGHRMTRGMSGWTVNTSAPGRAGPAAFPRLSGPGSYCGSWRKRSRHGAAPCRPQPGFVSEALSSQSPAPHGEVSRCDARRSHPRGCDSSRPETRCQQPVLAPSGGRPGRRGISSRS